ncbi:MAG TPA: PspC domain-containing protein [Fluviicola sp.]|nr:PspC domain-containing protein [Fluviicola sp.]
MKKTLSIHLGRQLFIIEEDAYTLLQEYLKKLEHSFHNEPSSTEILEDIEMRFAELLISYLENTRKVVTINDIELGIQSLGEPEVISEQTEKSNNENNHSENSTSDSDNQSEKRLYRDHENRMLGGVCAGIAAYFKIDPTLIRILFVIFLFVGFGFILYIFLWIIVPNARTTAEKLQMRGKPITIETLREEFEQSADRLKKGAKNVSDKFAHSGDHIAKRVYNLFQLIIRGIALFFISISLFWIGFFTFVVLGIINFIPTTGDTNYASLEQFLHLIIPTAHAHFYVWLGIIAVGYTFPLIIITLSLKAFVTLKRPYLRYLLFSWTAMLFLGILIGIVGTIQATRDYEVSSEIEKSTISINASQLTLLEKEHFIENHKVTSDDGIDFIHIKNNIIKEKGVQLIIKESPDSLYHVIQKFSAHGIDQTLAQKRSMRIKHELIVKNDTLKVDPYYYFPLSDGLRNQEIEVIIEIPKGKTLRTASGNISPKPYESGGMMYPYEEIHWYEDMD